MALAQEIAYYHHEKYNGEGYPEGLKGEDIPLSARIISAVDVYDALRTERPYKKPLPHEVTMEIMKKEMVDAFDPVILKKMGQINRQLQDIADDTVKSA